jgi:hypothetical protein
MEHKDYIAGLRELADFYESHPDVNLPYEGNLCSFGIYGLNKEQIVATVKAFGKCRKDYEETAVNIYKEFHGIKLNIYTARENVCRRVVVATNVEPEKTIPGKWVPEVVIPAKEVEVVEWRCDPILEPTEA